MRNVGRSISTAMAALTLGLTLTGASALAQAPAPAAAPPAAATNEWASAVAASAMTPDDIGLRLRVHGPVLAIVAPAVAGDPVRVVLNKDPQVVALFTRELAAEVGKAGKVPQVGGHVAVAGVVGEYTGELQITVTKVDDVAIVNVAAMPAPPPPGTAAVRSDPTVTAGQATDYLGQRVTITAPIAEYKTPWNDRAPHTLSLNDGTGSVDVVFWTDMADQMNLDGLKAGAKVTATGMAQSYKERLQLRLDAPGKLLVDGASIAKAGAAPVATAVAPAASATVVAPAADGSVPAASVGSYIGQDVTVVGSVKAVREAWNEKAPNIVTLADDSGSVEVVFWSQVRDALAPGIAAEGSRLRITGKAEEFKGKAQIKVSDAAKIQAVN